MRNLSVLNIYSVLSYTLILCIYTLHLLSTNIFYPSIPLKMSQKGLSQIPRFPEWKTIFPPLAQSMQEIWPTRPEYVPASQDLHASSDVCSAPASENFPSAQPTHAATVLTVEYNPPTHLLQVLAPGSSPVFVILPGPQVSHASTAEEEENFPASHAVQLVAPVFGPVFVKLPGSQAVHSATLETVEYLPAAH